MYPSGNDSQGLGLRDNRLMVYFCFETAERRRDFKEEILQRRRRWQLRYILTQQVRDFTVVFNGVRALL